MLQGGLGNQVAQHKLTTRADKGKLTRVAKGNTLQARTPISMCDDVRRNSFECMMCACANENMLQMLMNFSNENSTALIISAIAT